MVGVRRAVPGDAAAIAALVAKYAGRGEVLHRPAGEIAATIDDWVVGDDEGCLCACGSLRRVAPDRAEIRTVLVEERYQGNGWGAEVVEALIEMARQRRIGTVYALTLTAPFFQRMGFAPGNRAEWPEKVYGDCAWCAQRDNCTKKAMVRLVETAAPWEGDERREAPRAHRDAPVQMPAGVR
jgi:amino-acid N-acetyltransferase